MIAGHFGIARDLVKMILAKELGLQKYPKRWPPHQLSEVQKTPGVERPPDLLQILEDNRELQLDRIATRDESWFRYLIQSHSWFASS
jgi:hypothetical protein